MNQQLCIAILGPTASGKSDFALNLAKELNAELVCLDSTTVFEKFNIGTAKPDPKTRQVVPHHLIDCLKPDDELTAFDFVKMAEDAINEIQNRNKPVIIVGGTNFYFKCLQHGMYEASNSPPQLVEKIEAKYFSEEGEFDNERMHSDLTKIDPAAAKKIHPNDKYRMIRALCLFESTKTKPSEMKLQHENSNQKNRVWLKYALTIPRHELSSKISLRTSMMMGQGLIEETKNIRAEHPNAKTLQSVGYKECCDFLDGKLKDEKKTQNTITEKTRQLAKRQICWLRSNPEIHYINHKDLEQVLLEINNLQFTLNTAS